MASFTSAGPSSDPTHKRQGKRTSNEHQHAEVAGGAPSFTKVIAGKTTHHSAYCCRLSLPRKFCEENNIPDHVTMTDATGTRIWKMRLQVRCVSANHTISNGWREFSYDHSLKLGHELVFTLVSPSHFRVAFAAANGKRQLPMHPTRSEGDGYPWKQNYSRIACLSAILLPKQLQETIVTASPPEQEEKTVKLLTDVPMPVNNTKGQSSDELREKHTNPPKERFCQCKTFMVSTRRTMTHLERKNPDGSTYLQIVDSDTEID